jgi:tRNA(Ile)-lysidine synthase
MAPFCVAPGTRIAVGVSGGGDSMALVRLLAAWAIPKKVFVQAITVDHRLREAAAQESLQVGTWLDLHDIPHTVLTWNDGPHARTLTRSAQSAARQARYSLMTKWCLAHGYSHLFLAHHADDQVETFLLRLSRGSGVDGLAAMAPTVMRDGIVIARPLLGITKALLLAACRVMNQPWIEDPSNKNAASTRVRFREAQELLEREGLTRDRLLATVGHLQRARAALNYAVAALLDRGDWDVYGVARLPLAYILAAPEEIALRALSRVLTATGGQAYGPRFESLSRLYERMTVGPWADATLHGCFISRDGAHVIISREEAQITEDKSLAANTSVVWDRRFKLSLAATYLTPVFTISRLGRAADLTALSQAQRDKLGDIPARVRATLPALFDPAGLAALPHADFMRSDVALLPGLSLGLTSVLAEKSGHLSGDAKF